MPGMPGMPGSIPGRRLSPPRFPVADSKGLEVDPPHSSAAFHLRRGSQALGFRIRAAEAHPSAR
jgi:hypothetical protein